MGILKIFPIVVTVEFLQQKKTNQKRRARCYTSREIVSLNRDVFVGETFST
jgi:hypothetical protein